MLKCIVCQPKPGCGITGFDFGVMVLQHVCQSRCLRDKRSTNLATSSSFPPPLTVTGFSTGSLNNTPRSLAAASRRRSDTELDECCVEDLLEEAVQQSGARRKTPLKDKKKEKKQNPINDVVIAPGASPSGSNTAN